MVLNEHRAPQKTMANARYANNAKLRQAYLLKNHERCRKQLRDDIVAELHRMDLSTSDSTGWDDLPLEMRVEKPSSPSLNQIRLPSVETLRQGFTHVMPALGSSIEGGLVRGESIPSTPLIP